MHAAPHRPKDPTHLDDLDLWDALDDGAHGVVDVARNERGEVEADGEAAERRGGGGREAGERRGVDALEQLLDLGDVDGRDDGAQGGDGLVDLVGLAVELAQVHVGLPDGLARLRLGHRPVLIVDLCGGWSGQSTTA